MSEARRYGRAVVIGQPTVGKGCVYVIGDNRSVPIEEAVFGEAQLKRIMGGTLW